MLKVKHKLRRQITTTKTTVAAAAHWKTVTHDCIKYKIYNVNKIKTRK
jgi:hypothetical protein